MSLKPLESLFFTKTVKSIKPLHLFCRYKRVSNSIFTEISFPPLGMPVIFQRKESMMLHRTLLFSVIVVAVYTLFLFGTSAVAADEKAFSLHVDNVRVDSVVILGQNQNRTPTI